MKKTADVDNGVSHLITSNALTVVVKVLRVVD